MIRWNKITSIDDLKDIDASSHHQVCMILKHSTRCSISSMALSRLESHWNTNVTEVKAYYLDLIAHRGVSNAIAETYKVHHESPQILLIKDGNCFHDASHLDISVDEIEEVLPN